MPTTRRKRANPPDQPENNNHLADQPENTAEVSSVEPAPAPATEAEADATVPATPEPTLPENSVYSPVTPVPPQQMPSVNGERSERAERQDYPAPIEGGRRTARGELFRRPPQPPIPPASAMPTPAAPLQAPVREISLPLGNLLHLAYNPGYTGADEARSMLLHQLAAESKAGGRARCWNCGSIAVAYDRWNTRSRTLGEIGIAFCEICGVWSVL
jgi:hypothetical protein